MARVASARKALQQHAVTPLAEITGVGNVQILSEDADLDPETDLIHSTAATEVVLRLPSVDQVILGKEYGMKQGGAGTMKATPPVGTLIDGLASLDTTGIHSKRKFVAYKVNGTVVYGSIT